MDAEPVDTEGQVYQPSEPIKPIPDLLGAPATYS